jgi:flagellar assembly protein FliH
MAIITKFSFDTTFDATDQFVASEEEETLPPEPTYSEAELATAREQGYADGFQKATDEARDSIETATASALEDISRQLTEMESILTEGLQQSCRTAVGLGGAIARKMMDKIVQDNAQTLVESVITDVLGRVLEEPRVVIRVSDRILDPLKENLSVVTQKSGFPGSIILLAEPGIQSPNCRIEWADGGADYAYDNLWTELDGIIERFTMALGSEDDQAVEATADTSLPAPENMNPEEQSNG